MKRIVFDREVVDADVQRLKALGYPDELIEIFISDGQARARLLGNRLPLIDRIRLLFLKEKS